MFKLNQIDDYAINLDFSTAPVPQFNYYYKHLTVNSMRSNHYSLQKQFILQKFFRKANNILESELIIKVLFQQKIAQLP